MTHLQYKLRRPIPYSEVSKYTLDKDGLRLVTVDKLGWFNSLAPLPQAWTHNVVDTPFGLTDGVSYAEALFTRSGKLYAFVVTGDTEAYAFVDFLNAVGEYDAEYGRLELPEEDPDLVDLELQFNQLDQHVPEPSEKKPKVGESVRRVIDRVTTN
jgi:hypothetical protein